jgi:dephospho-CoA kinase
MFAKRGWTVIDVDKIGHDVLIRPAVVRAVRKRFGSVVLDSEGGVDRKILGMRVFRDQKSLAELNRIVHPAMSAEVRKRLRHPKGRGVVVDAALLFPMGLDRYCGMILQITAPRNLLLRRARKDRGIAAGTARRILKAQSQGRNASAKSDIKIINDSTPAVFRKRLGMVLDLLGRMED